MWQHQTGRKDFTIFAFSLFNFYRTNGEKNPDVKHYQIKQAETGEATFYLAEKYLFSTIPELIHYHQHNAAGKAQAFPARCQPSHKEVERLLFPPHPHPPFQSLSLSGVCAQTDPVLQQGCKNLWLGVLGNTEMFDRYVHHVVVMAGLITRLRCPVSKERRQSVDIDLSKGQTQVLAPARVPVVPLWTCAELIPLI